MSNYYTVIYQYSANGISDNNVQSNPSFTIIGDRTFSGPLVSANGKDYAGTFEYYKGNVVQSEYDKSGLVTLLATLFIYEGGNYVGSVSFITCWLNNVVKFTENVSANIVQATGKFVGSFGLPLYVEVDNTTGNRIITFQYN